MDNRAGEMEVFAAAVELGSFSAAGRRLKLSPSAVSKLINRIEDRLGARLLLRSTRALRLTPEGERYLARAQRILAEIEETEREIASGAEAAPRGRVRVNALVGFGVRCVVPLIPEFLARYPEVELDLTLTDSIVDLMEGRVDVALRSGTLRDSALKARKILESRRVVIASPDYLVRHGTPKTPTDLARHNCLLFNFRQNPYEWPFRDPATGEVAAQQVSGKFFGDNGPTLRQLCLEGLGLARLGEFHVAPDLAAGRLVTVLERYNPEDIELIHAIFPGHQHLPARVRVFVDFLAERIRRER
jgi:DNA-binding transcriptional LysR family regulator